MMRHRKGRIMEMADMTVPDPGATLPLNLLPAPPPVIVNPSVPIPIPNEDPKLGLFQQLVLSIEKSNAMKK